MNDFDTYAKNYEGALQRGIAISGEDSAFFAKGRIEWLKMCMQKLNRVAHTVLDYGCGIGSATPFLFESLGAKSVVGVDLSQEALNVARRSYRSFPVEYKLINDLEPRRNFDLVFCNGVFHHIPPNERSVAIQYIANHLRPRGIFSLWENNPWNPGTRYVMSRISFDRDAIPLTKGKASALVASGGFNVIRIDHYFVFPAFLKFLRSLEPYLTWTPLGAQYQILSRLED